MIIVSSVLGSLGLVCIIARRTFLGLMIGFQLLSLGAVVFFLFAGIVSGSRQDGQIVALFLVLGSVAQLVIGYAIAIRQFYLRNKTDVEELRVLKQ